MPPKAKQRLRTASDVISRLRWSPPLSRDDGNDTGDPSVVMVGYDDRVNGPMEKPVEDFVSIANGGDIPEHRILYFRRTTLANPNTERGQIIWDRAGRVDRVFGSGNGAQGAVAKETTNTAKTAMANMIRLENEKEERREIKAKERARKARKRAALKENQNSQLAAEPRSGESSRFAWEPIDWYVYDRSTDDWVSSHEQPQEEVANKDWDAREELVVVTWNILFDIFDDGIKTEDGSESTQSRWKCLASCLTRSDADVIALQEVTPSFVEVLLSSDSIRADFASTAAPSETATIDPSGVLLLWRRCRLHPFAQCVFGCFDNGRNRSVAAALARMDATTTFASVVLIGNAHLPADQAVNAQAGGADKSSRHIARRRELSSIVGQLERVEYRVLNAGNKRTETIPFLVGDFNCDAKDFADGSFSGVSGMGGFFEDIWSLVGSGPGMTFDPRRNPRAARSCALVGKGIEGRRIDRIYVRRNARHLTTPSTARLLGCDLKGLAPSDHFGVRASLRFSRAVEYKAGRRDAALRFSFAATSIPSPDVLLAVVLDDSDMERAKRDHDGLSSFVLPHITLLHGFVEIHAGCLDLVTSAVKDAVYSTSCSLSEPLHFDFSNNSVDIFEHRSSATVVVSPLEDSAGGQWLRELYSALRDRFRLCDEQEKHSSLGWKPHVSLGKFGSTASARAAAAKMGSWINGHRRIPIRTVDLMQRGCDGKFQTIASVPMWKSPSPKTTMDFLKDAGGSLSVALTERAETIASKVESVCRQVAQVLGSVEATVHLVGSTRLRVALPMLSDVDAVVVVKPATFDVECSGAESPAKAMKAMERAASGDYFLKQVSARLREQYPPCKTRFRSAANARVLTIKLFPNFVPMDLLFCRCDANMCPIDPQSKLAFGAIKDADWIIDIVNSTEGCNVDICEGFKGALRIIKRWADDRDIYGANAGFLGGGGWATLLARIFCDAVRTGVLSFDSKPATTEISHQIAAVFFVEAARWPWPKVVSLDDLVLSFNEAGGTTQVSAETKTREGMAVVAPYSHGNYGRNSTKCTTFATADELRHAATQIVCVKNSSTLSLSLALEKVLARRSLEEFTEPFSCILAVELLIFEEVQEECCKGAKSTTGSSLWCNSTLRPVELKAFGCMRVLQLVVDLELAFGDASLVRPRPKPLRAGKEWRNLTGEEAEADGTKIDFGSPSGFVWLVGIHRPAQEVRPIIRQMETQFISDLGSALLTAGCEQRGNGCYLRVLEPEEATSRLVPCRSARSKGNF